MSLGAFFLGGGCWRKPPTSVVLSSRTTGGETWFANYLDWGRGCGGGGGGFGITEGYDTSS